MDTIKIEGLENINLKLLPKLQNNSRDTLLKLYWRFHPRFRFMKNVSLNSKFLDIGAGSGGLSFWKEWDMPLRKDIEMYGLDLSIGEYSRNYKEFKICNLDKDGIIYDAEVFDVVFGSHLMEHLHNEKEFVREVHRVLKKGGSAYIEIPTPQTLNYPSRKEFLAKGINVSTINFFDDQTHIKTYELDSLRNMFSELGFLVVESGIVENKYLADELFTYGMKNNDQEVLTYSVWSKLRWSQYLIVEKV